MPLFDDRWIETVTETDWDALRASIERLSREVRMDNTLSTPYMSEWTWEPAVTEKINRKFKKKTVEEKIKEMEQRFLTRNDPRPDLSW